MPRPKKEEKEEPSKTVQKIAEIIQNFCGIPGCSYKFHLEEAQQVLDTLNEDIEQGLRERE